MLAVVAVDGRRHSLRALLDSGSQASFITDRAATNLLLHRFHSPVCFYYYNIAELPSFIRT